MGWHCKDRNFRILVHAVFERSKCVGYGKGKRSGAYVNVVDLDLSSSIASEAESGLVVQRIVMMRNEAKVAAIGPIRWHEARRRLRMGDGSGRSCAAEMSLFSYMLLSAFLSSLLCHPNRSQPTPGTLESTLLPVSPLRLFMLTKIQRETLVSSLS